MAKRLVSFVTLYAVRALGPIRRISAVVCTTAWCGDVHDASRWDWRRQFRRTQATPHFSSRHRAVRGVGEVCRKDTVAARGSVLRQLRSGAVATNHIEARLRYLGLRRQRRTRHFWQRIVALRRRRDLRCDGDDLQGNEDGPPSGRRRSLRHCEVHQPAVGNPRPRLPMRCVPHRSFGRLLERKEARGVGDAQTSLSRLLQRYLPVPRRINEVIGENGSDQKRWEEV